MKKRWIREVGKPVSTTRDPPRLGDCWRSDTNLEIRPDLDFFQGKGMAEEGPIKMKMKNDLLITSSKNPEKEGLSKR